MKDPALRKLQDIFPPEQVVFGESLREHTTFGIGGPADALVTAYSLRDLTEVLRFARDHSIPFLVLGGGSNVLVRDKGVRGIVILNRAREKAFAPVDAEMIPEVIEAGCDAPSALSGDSVRSHLLDGDRRLVRAASGTPLQQLITMTCSRNLVGLEYFAGIPGTVGGALFNNAHGGGKQIGDYILAVEYIDSTGKTVLATPRQLHFGYDRSDFRRHHEWVVTRVLFSLHEGDGREARRRFQECLAERGRHAGRSAGCVFANLSEYQRRKAGLPSCSVGYINDRILGIRGLRRGDAVLGRHHGNFITNEGEASAEDVLSIIREVRRIYRERFGLRLRLEIRVI